MSSTFTPNSTIYTEPEVVAHNPQFDEDAYRMVGFKRVLSITSIILICVVWIILIILSRYLECREGLTSTTAKRAGKFFFISFILSLLLYSICSITCVYMMFNIETIERQDRWTVIFLVAALSYQCGRLVTEMYFIGRLYFVFGESAYSMSKWGFIAFIILTILSFVSAVIGNITGALKVFPFYPDTNHIHPPMMFGFVAAMVGCIVSGFVIYEFIRILYKVYAQSAARGNVQEQMLHTISKHSLLSIIGLASNFIVYTYPIFEWVLDLLPDPVFSQCRATIDGAINTVVMVFVFSWTSALYKKSCFCCSGGVTKCCVWCTSRSVKRKQTQDAIASKSSKTNTNAEVEL